ncbi:cobalt-precorrin-6A reductase [Pleurocapsa sp. PCC 7319]|uniref:cobalt-precorrin-6A reductase n=1 Tax=Pleurocapsa sp. PCC 7319 TaxID=118161 RepID=UPI00034AD323|nr:cobalt-precorrin-6A reductase [Pleurocapsa sp. PCC 7319]
MRGNIWLIGGTSESVTLAKAIASYQIPLVITVTSQSAKSLYPLTSNILVGCMDQIQMQSFCEEQMILAVVDASHPYAVEVSRQAIAVTTQLKIPYLRFERINYQPSDSISINSSIIQLDSFTTLLSGKYLQNQRVLLTVGCKSLPLFQVWQDRATLFARILPKIESLEIALESGFTSDRLIAIRPPISINLEIALWRKWQISLVVTKASGKAGGENIKRQVAAELEVPLIIIARPQVPYPQKTSIIPEVLAFCSRVSKIDSGKN